MFKKRNDFDTLDKDYKVTIYNINNNLSRFAFSYGAFSTGIVHQNIIYDQLNNIDVKEHKPLFIIWSDYGEYVEYIFNKFGYDVNLKCVCFTEYAKNICMWSLERYTHNPENFVIFIEGDIEDITPINIIKNKDMGIFNYIVGVGNPPYQGVNHQQLYPKIYKWCIENCDEVCLIFPTGWMEPKTANGLAIMNTPEIKYDCQIVSIDKRHNVFPNVGGAEWTNIIHWKKDYDNNLDGSQLIYTNGENPVAEKLKISKDEVNRPKEIKDIVSKLGNFIGMDTVTGERKPYLLNTDFLNDPTKQGLPDVLKAERENSDDIGIYGLINKVRTIKYVSKDYPLPKPSENCHKDYFKVLIPKAWGNLSKGFVGGAYGNICISFPSYISTDSYIESGYCKDFEEVKKHAKYCMSKFARALIMDNKFTIMNSKSIWKSVPIQDYSEVWWDSDDLDEIDNHLFDKYNIPEDIRDFIRKNIQPKSVKNIIGYNTENFSEDE